VTWPLYHDGYTRRVYHQLSCLQGQEPSALFSAFGVPEHSAHVTPYLIYYRDLHVFCTAQWVYYVCLQGCGIPRRQMTLLTPAIHAIRTCLYCDNYAYIHYLTIPTTLQYRQAKFLSRNNSISGSTFTLRLCIYRVTNS
ncbi:hypothetical protein WG66_001730, partial [Moniliophthora roreri]